MSDALYVFCLLCMHEMFVYVSSTLLLWSIPSSLSRLIYTTAWWLLRNMLSRSARSLPERLCYRTNSYASILLSDNCCLIRKLITHYARSPLFSCHQTIHTWCYLISANLGPDEVMWTVCAQATKPLDSANKGHSRWARQYPKYPQGKNIRECYKVKMTFLEAYDQK